MGFTKWMSENEGLSAAVFIAASVAIMGLYEFLERRYKQRR